MSEYVLNASQQAVAQADDTPMLVVAGPGAGKTTVLRARIERLLRASQYDRILAITFTNVAAANLRKKLEDLTGELLQRVRVGTFHNFAASILRQHGAHIGLRNDFQIENEDSDRREIYVEALSRISWQPEPNNDFLPLLSRLLERGATRENIDRYVDSSINSQLVGEALEKYIEVSVERAQLDFPLLVYLANKLLLANPGIAKQLRRTYKYICIDEFQDTNDAQFRLLSAICEHRASGVLLLADQDQVIYQWNGASVGRLSEAEKTFDASVFVLPTSFRCPDVIVRAASNLIAHNAKRFVSPAFESALERQGSIVVKGFSDESAENSWIVQQLQNLSPDDYDQTAVLARNRKRLDSLLAKCEAASIPAMIPTPRFEFVSPPLIILHSMLRLAQRFQRRHLLRLCDAFAVVPGISLDAKTIEAEAAAKDVPVLQAFVTSTKPIVNVAEYDAVCDYVEKQLLARKEFWDFSSLVLRWIDSQRKDGDVYEADFDEERPIWMSLEHENRGLRSDRVSLSEFLQRIDLESKAPPIVGRVRLMTVHGAKGLEYDRVYLIGASEGQFPTFQATKLGDNSDAMQEERRSFFVAITRCRADLVITYPTSYMGYRKVPSRFIREMSL